MTRTTIVYFFAILAVVNTESENYLNGKTSLEAEISDLKQFVTRQNQLNTMLLEKDDKMMQQNQRLTLKTKDLEMQNQILMEKTKRLEVQNQQLTRQLADQRKQTEHVEEMKYEFKQLQEFCVESNGASKRLLLMNQPHPVSDQHPTTAFTARIGQHHQTGIGNQLTIIFDDVVTNVGNAYSPVTGVFTATTNGTFFFFTSILSHYGDYVETELVKNGVQVALTFGKDTSHDQGSNAAALILTQGDKVWVRHLGHEGTQVYGYGWSSFTGFQV